MTRATKLTIDLSAIRANYQLAIDRAPNSQTLAVVKADAYGHGIKEVLSVLGKAPAFAVATIDEAIHLRTLTDTPILILQGVMRADELAEAKEHKLTPMVHQANQLKLFAEHPTAIPAAVWLKLDSGMSRLGFKADEVNSALQQLRHYDAIDELVVCSHFANASSPDSVKNQQQLEQLLTLKAQYPDLKYSMANSAAILSDPSSHFDWNRAGIMLYGGSPFDDINHPDNQLLQPTMTLTSEVIAIRTLDVGDSVGYGETWRAERPSRIATVAAGYADGYPRHAPNGTPVYIAGKRLPLVGRVSMDMITVDVTDAPDVQLGETAELFGQHVAIDVVAERAGTISYQLMTSITERVRRAYVSGE